MNALVKPSEKIMLLKGALEKQLPAIRSIAAKHLNPERMLKVALSATSRNKLLLSCTIPSIVKSVMMASELGLEAGSALGEAYLVPYKNNQTGEYEAQLIPGYRGLISLARRSGEVANIFAEAVYPGDRFEVELGLEPKLVHVPKWDSDERDNSSNITFAYAVAKFKDLSYQFVVMSRKQLDSIRNRSKARDNGPWVTDYEEMCKKTTIRRLSKYLPLSVEMARAIDLQVASESGDFEAIDIGDEIIADPKPEVSGVENLKKRLGRPPGTKVVETTVAAPETQPAPPDEQEKPSGDEQLREYLRGKIRDWSPSVKASWELAIKHAIDLNSLKDIETAIQDRLQKKQEEK